MKRVLMPLGFIFVFESIVTECTLVLFLHYVHPEIDRWVSRRTEEGLHVP
jgi:hypothetical protein